MAWLADYLIKKQNLSVVFLPFLYGRDNYVMNDIKRCMKNPAAIVDAEYLKPVEALEIIGKSELLIGMRLHSIIYGAVSKVPMMIISYSAKVRGMAKYLKMDEYSLDVDFLNKSDMANIINKVLKNKVQIQNDLNITVEIIRKREKRNQEILGELQNDLIMG